MRTYKEVQEARREAIGRLERGEKNLSFTSVKTFKDSPRDLIDYIIGLGKDTAAMRNSKQSHVMVLEGEEAWDKLFVYLPIKIPYPSSENGREMMKMVVEGMDEVEAYTRNYSTKNKSEAKIASEAKAKVDECGEYIEFMRNVNGREIVLEKDWRLMVEQRDVMWRDPFFREFAENCEIEVEVKDWEHEGLKFNGRIDMLRSGLEGADYKNFVNVRPRYFRSVIFNEWIHVQGALYCKMGGIPFKEKRWYIFACDKNFGNVHHATYNIREDALAMGWDKFNEILKWYKHCLLLGAWEESYGFFSEGEHGIFDVHCPWWYHG